MNTRIIISLAIAFSLFLIACDKDDDDSTKPVISGLEVGHQDTIHIGEGIHLSFKVSDNEALKSYRILIHPEEGHKSAATLLKWKYDSTFREISGQKSLFVHHHKILVPKNTAPGDYHFHLSVTDEAGNLTEVEKEIHAALEEGDHDHDHNHNH